MNRIALREFYGAAIVDWIAGDVEQTPEHAFTDWHADRRAGIGYAHAALEAFGRRHGDRAHPIFPEVLLHFERQLGWVTAYFVLDLERTQFSPRCCCTS